MREIKFRGKRIDNGEWAQGELVTHYFRPKEKCYNIYNCDTDDTEYEIDENTLGQYTGIKDRNGTKIFEGDILRLCESTKPFLIYWSGIAWAAKNMNGKKKEYAFGSDLILECEKCKIIGNIYDNPKLLEGEE